MTVFLSWSGDRGKLYARNMAIWLPRFVPNVEVFVSADIDPGVRSFNAIEGALRSCTYGICCLTAEALDSPWLHFEAGAMANSLAQFAEDTRLVPVVPLLFDGLLPSAVKPPLSEFQIKPHTKEDLRGIVANINLLRHRGGNNPELIDILFEKFWPDYERHVQNIASMPADIAVPRSSNDMIEELLNLTRAISPISDASTAYNAEISRAYFARIVNLRKTILHKGEQSGVSLRILGDGHAPDLVVRNDIFIGVEVEGFRRSLPDLLSQAYGELSRYRRRSNSTAQLVVVFASDSVLRISLMAPGLVQAATPIVWYGPDEVFRGNEAARKLVPWLVDAEFSDLRGL